MDRISNEFHFDQALIRLREQRQQVLAGNIANADTPGFKARDLDFRQALLTAHSHSGSATAGQLVLTSKRHLPGGVQRVLDTPLLYRVPAQAALDGNSVDMDVERVQFAENTLNYQTDLTVISQRIKALRMALQP